MKKVLLFAGFALAAVLAAISLPSGNLQAQSAGFLPTWCWSGSACTSSYSGSATGTFPGGTLIIPANAQSISVTIVSDTVTSAYTASLQTAPVAAGAVPGSFTQCATATISTTTGLTTLTCTASTSTPWGYAQLVMSGGSAAGGFHGAFYANLPSAFGKNGLPSYTQTFSGVASAALTGLSLTPGQDYRLTLHITSTSFTSGTPGFIGLQFCTTDPTCASAVTTGYNGAGVLNALSGGVTTWGGWSTAPVLCVDPVKASGSTCATDSFATTYSNALTFYVTFQDPGNTSSNKTATLQGVYSDSSALLTAVTGAYCWSNSGGTLPAVTGIKLASYVGGSPGGTMSGSLTFTPI
jgi:hypothetical protein